MVSLLFSLILWPATKFASLTTLAYRPFLDPMGLDAPWLVLAVPMVLAVAVVYKAIKLDDLADLPRHALAMATQVLVIMVAAAIVLWVLTEVM